jgi:hypothetical protein
MRERERERERPIINLVKSNLMVVPWQVAFVEVKCTAH